MIEEKENNTEWDKGAFPGSCADQKEYQQDGDDRDYGWDGSDQTCGQGYAVFKA